jgi:hypothetical protein
MYHLCKIYTDLKLNEFQLDIGVNFLDSSDVEQTINFLEKSENNFKMIWHDNFIPDKILRQDLNFNGLYFGGVAFKYQIQPKEEELESVCIKAKKYVDVITTSGDFTGKAASIKKIETIKNYIGDFPLAVASGITAENINNYKDLVDYVLVASSITNNEEIIEKNKLENLINKI